MPSCAGCRAPLPPQRRRANPRKWCSEACRVKSYRKPRGSVACAGCSVEIDGSNGRKYCAPQCMWRASGERRRMPQDFTCAKCGEPFTREVPKRGRRPQMCPPCASTRRREIPAAVRLAVYERDQWTCQLCHESVDPSAVAGSAWSPTLDHIEFWSAGGSDEPDNLRLAHHWCNSVRADGRLYDDDFFRAVS